jgi:hypothetical protein
MKKMSITRRAMEDPDTEVKDRQTHNCTEADPAYRASGEAPWHIRSFLFSASLTSMDPICPRLLR